MVKFKTFYTICYVDTLDSIITESSAHLQDSPARCPDERATLISSTLFSPALIFWKHSTMLLQEASCKTSKGWTIVLQFLMDIKGFYGSLLQWDSPLRLTGMFYDVCLLNAIKSPIK